ncbi:hypothetical protein D8O27_11355 [Burkholderia mallei]|uniref:Uncharacterized protein n=2 Tax=Burkholderia mallei TaxID=13373 RepID=A0AAX1X917_BURML|nr:hypothetical protein BMA0364 [Burkholderia mallei ATCC 23344]AYX27132.1 hypothetical protein EGY16_02260 [Burkholderia pseudomallei]RKN98765.1 hypothetical protein D8O31_11735 [Burkholderia mallei]MBG1250544.1 hypothetical protein [Burkholderia pseudomallei]MBK3337125.1 hypothetical protein [Burkholderia pseudomallei]
MRRPRGPRRRGLWRGQGRRRLTGLDGALRRFVSFHCARGVFARARAVAIDAPMIVGTTVTRRAWRGGASRRRPKWEPKRQAAATR